MQLLPSAGSQTVLVQSFTFKLSLNFLESDFPNATVRVLETYMAPSLTLRKLARTSVSMCSSRG